MLTSSFIIGFFGDLGLQLIAHVRGDIVGLSDYFKQHHSLESAFIAAGMMVGFTLLYQLSGLPVSWSNLFLYGVVLDVIFRNVNLMPSLTDTYYKHITPLNSMLWGGLPFVMSWYLERLISEN